MTDTADTQPEKLPLTAMDIAEEKRELLKQCLAAAFPEVMAEDNIDFDQLKRVLGEWVEPDRERYGLNWPGKAACMKVIQAPSVGTLKPCPEVSVDWDTTENLFIEGDNLEVLKLLQKAYFGKVKMIYIDPPYNTGKEFIYPDKYSETLDTYLEYTGQKDSEGRKFSTNTDASGRFHSRWLNMMYPRLYLAKNLLKRDGIIFISIDDGEQSNLKALCDQVFGEENFISCVTWRRKKESANDNKGFSAKSEYVLVYGRSDSVNVKSLPLSDEYLDKSYNEPCDEFPLGKWRPVPIAASKGHQGGGYVYDVTTPSGRVISDKIWLYPEDSFNKLKDEGRIFFGKSGDGIPQRVSYDFESKGTPPSNIWLDQGTNKEGKNEYFNLLGISSGETPKPKRLILEMMEITGIEPGDIVLDFFAGSATTGHAVWEATLSGKPQAHFVMVQLPEMLEEGSEAQNAGYSTIAEIGKERLRRASNALRKDHPDSNGDLGFRVFQLSESCFKRWDGSSDGVDDTALLSRIEAHGDHVDATAKPEDILFELLLKDGFPLTVPMQRLEVAGKEVFSIGEGALLICLEKELTHELMDALAEIEPARVICLDVGFKGNDQLKANAVQTFKARARTKETAIEFRTV